MRRRERIRRRACLHELFEAQVERTPEAVAVVCEERAAELWGTEPAGQSTGALSARRGVGPEMLVGVLHGAVAWRWWWGCWGC